MSLGHIWILSPFAPGSVSPSTRPNLSQDCPLGICHLVYTTQQWHLMTSQHVPWILYSMDSFESFWYRYHLDICWSFGISTYFNWVPVEMILMLRPRTPNVFRMSLMSSASWQNCWYCCTVNDSCLTHSQHTTAEKLACTKLAATKSIAWTSAPDIPTSAGRFFASTVNK